MKKKLPPGTLSFGGVTIGEVNGAEIEPPYDFCEFRLSDMPDVEFVSIQICTPTCDEWALIEQSLFPHRFN